MVKVDADTFYKHYFIDKLSKPEIKAIFKITEKTFHVWTAKVRKMQLSEITTPSIEKELLEMYNLSLDPKVRLKLLDLILKVWEKKQNVHVPQKKAKIDASMFMALGDPTATTP